MFRAITAGLCIGIAVQALRGWPDAYPMNRSGVLVLFVVASSCAYCWGRYGGAGRRGSSATAVAVASAEASAVASSQQAVNVLIVNAPDGARTEASSRVRVPDPASSLWMGTDRLELSESDLDGMDSFELADARGLSPVEESAPD
jgi:hypothetical protein